MIDNENGNNGQESSGSGPNGEHPEGEYDAEAEVAAGPYHGDVGEPVSDTRDAGPREGLFAPLISLINAARDVHPAAGFLLVILAIFAVGSAIFKIAAEIAGDYDIYRTVLFIALMLIFLLLLVAFVADFVVASSKQKTATRIQRGILLLIMGLAGGYGVWQVSNPNKENCAVRNFLIGFGAAKCSGIHAQPESEPGPIEPVPGPIVQPEPEPAKPPVIYGSIESASDSTAIIKNAFVKVSLGAQTYGPKVNELGSFIQELPSYAVDRNIRINITAPGYKSVINDKITVLAPSPTEPFTEKVWPLSRAGTTPVPLPPLNYKLRDKVKLPTFEKKIVSAAVVKNARWFDGKGGTFDIFYCQPPQGDTSKSATLAAKLQKILYAQRNIARVRVRAWPKQGTKGYDIPGKLKKMTLLFDYHPQNRAINQQLYRLWRGQLVKGERTGRKVIKKPVKGYISVLVCRQ